MGNWALHKKKHIFFSPTNAYISKAFTAVAPDVGRSRTDIGVTGHSGKQMLSVEHQNGPCCGAKCCHSFVHMETKV